MIKYIEHLGIYSKDTAALKDWYLRVLGFKVVSDNGKGTYFIKAPGGGMIELVNAVEDGGVLGDKVSGLRHVALWVDNFEEMVEKLKEEKVVVVSDAVVGPTGVKTFFFRDPDGNVLHLINRPETLG